MARSSKPVPATRFSEAPTAVVRLGTSDKPPGRYQHEDIYGFHFQRVLPDYQTITYTILSGGILVEKINFVPSKFRRDGNAAYGNRWLGIVEYRQGEDYVSDMEFAVANGMKMAPEVKAGSVKSASVWKSC